MRKGNRHQTSGVSGISSSNHRIIELSNPVVFLLSVICCLTTASAQDLHFSQFFAAPLSTSPSNTGFFNGDWRVGGNFKSQWPWAIKNSTFNYRTFAAYCDFSLLKETLPKNDWMGVGAVILNDKTGDGNLKTTKILASVAYHKSFGTFKKYVLSIGIGGGYVIKSIDYSRLYFNEQWDPDGLLFNQALNNQEPANSLLSYFDLSAGTHFTYFHNDKINFSAGIALFHLNKPKDRFSDKDNRLGIRPVVSAVAFARLNKKIHFEPSFEFMYQKKAQEYIINLLVGITILSPKNRMKNSIVLIGSAYRPRDAWIPMAGLQWKTLRVIFNYDVNLSSLTEASRANGGFEMSVVYTGASKSSQKRMVPCPRL